MTASDFAKQDFPGAEMLGHMFLFYISGKVVRNVAQTKALNPHISDFKSWVARNKDAILAALQ